MPNKAKIIFQADGSPYSESFDDIYFDTESGFLQSEQVFIEGNNIASRLIDGGLKFTIAETGFGTGLNFILTLALYTRLDTKHTLPPLHFITTEKYPLTKAQLSQSLTPLSELTETIQLLINAYPASICENTTLTFLNGKVTLTLLIGDATERFKQLPADKSGIIDAWYLDGFSPVKNPDMWQPGLFDQVARLSKAEATVSTFTVAGIVRRGLSSVGFRTKKQYYGGKKKEILVGQFQQSLRFGLGYKIRPTRSKPQHVTIIGGGIASACIAYFLTKQDINVTILSKHKALAQGASSNKVGAVYPLLHQEMDEISVFHQQAFNFAINFYQSLTDIGLEYSHQWCGLLELSHSDALRKRQQQFQLSQWPDSLIHAVDQAQASQLTGLKLNDGGLFIPQAGWVAPSELVAALLSECIKSGRLKIKFNVNVCQINQFNGNKWQLTTNKGSLKASTLVLAGGADMISLDYAAQLPLTPVRGQVSEMGTNEIVKNLKSVICHKGYITPEFQGIHCIGATFEKNTTDITPKARDDDYNLSILDKTMPHVIPWQRSDVVNHNARIRCMTPDHMPIAGPMPDITTHATQYAHLAKDKNWRFEIPAPMLKNLYVLSGLGARGLCTAPLLAKVLEADICGTPYPVDNHMLFNISANRFIIRDIIKRKIKVNE